ncbi:MAG: dCTP deaminase [Bdellovibrionota bacterium]|nr:MAG: dCTP deaminase [Bdellovibrionota bacterium]
MVKPDHWIRAFGLEGGILPFVEDQINPASYDVTLGSHWICPTRDPEEVEVDSITLFPGEVVLATTREYLKMPRDVVCDLKLKSSLGRLWLNHSLSGWIDPNFQGQVTLELQNLGPYPRVLTAGMRIAQLVFIGMESPPEVAYGEKGPRALSGTKRCHTRLERGFFPTDHRKTEEIERVATALGGPMSLL